jgi:hypothetical protein
MIDVARNSLRKLSVNLNMEIVLPVISSMSTIYANMGYNEESIDIIKEGLSMCENPNSSQAALLYNNLAIHAIMRKDYRTGVQLLKKTMSLADATLK